MAQILKLSDQEYHQLEQLSNSALKDFEVSPEAFYHKWILKNPRMITKSKAMDIGSAIHCALLEPELFDEQFSKKHNITNAMQKKLVENIAKLLHSSTVKTNTKDDIKGLKIAQASFLLLEAGYKNPKDSDLYKYLDNEDFLNAAWIEYKKLKNKSNSISLTESELFMINELCSITKERSEWQAIFEEQPYYETLIEQTILFEIDGIPMKCKIDINREGLEIHNIYDVKTIGNDISPAKAALYYKYYRQLALYKMALMQVYKLREDQVNLNLIFISKEFPYPMTIVNVNNLFRKGESEIFELLKKYKSYKEFNRFSEAEQIILE